MQARVNPKTRKVDVQATKREIDSLVSAELVAACAARMPDPDISELADEAKTRLAMLIKVLSPVAKEEAVAK